jgi:hypothetical protein
VALGVLSTGRVPGEGATGSGAAALVAVLSMLAASGALAVLAVRAGERPGAPWVLLAAAAYLVARFFTFDPYYAPTLRRMSDRGAVAGSWIALLTATAVAVALLGLRHARLAGACGVLVCLLLAATSAFEGAGH